MPWGSVTRPGQNWDCCLGVSSASAASQGDGVGGRWDKLGMHVRRASGATELYFKNLGEVYRTVAGEGEGTDS